MTAQDDWDGPYSFWQKCLKARVSNDEKCLAGFSGSQQTGNRRKKRNRESISSNWLLGLTLKYTMLGKKTYQRWKKPHLRKILRPGT